MKSSYLEPYLRRAAKQPDNLQILDIMWKFYEKDKNYSAAARILAKLADRDTGNLTLWDRIDYVSRAILCAKACSTTLHNEGEFLHELEDKMDVAQLQLNIYSCLEQMTSSTEAAVSFSKPKKTGLKNCSMTCYNPKALTSSKITKKFFNHMRRLE